MRWLALVMAANVALARLIRRYAGDAVRASRPYFSRDHRAAPALRAALLATTVATLASRVAPAALVDLAHRGAPLGKG
jgi:hypothetical protein